MKMSNEQLGTALPSGDGGKQPEPFTPPEVPSLASLTDGRDVGQYQSAYSRLAWLQIALELIYLLSLLCLALIALALLAKFTVLKETHGPVFALIGDPAVAAPLVVYGAVALAGICGGCASSLKWLYHAVAKQRWHRDRVIWRIIVPPVSGVLALFTALMIISGIVPFLNHTSLSGPASGAALGFFVGLFSDNVLAALQKLAFRVFGTTDERTSSTPEPRPQDGAPKAE